MRLFVGLGNPGQKYQHNRHNIGFMAVDAIAHRHNFSPWSKKFQGEIAEGLIDGKKVTLLKPQTFMNLSGQSVQAAVAFYKIALNEIAVFYDELDLIPGKTRTKKGGGAGGHNGIRSIDQHLGQDYWRVRLGIGHPGNKDMVSPYVLGDFAKAEQPWLEDLLDALSRHAALMAADDTGLYMTRVAHDMQAHVKEDAKETGAEKTEKKEKENGL